MVKSMNVVRLFLQETGRYGQQFSRPYQAVTSFETLDNLNRRIEDVTRGDPTGKINGSLIAGLSAGLVTPSANWERELTIANGFNEQRLRFMLEVHVDNGFTTEIYFFQGYTEFVGVSYTGAIDPQMVFYINSFLRINRARDFSGLSSAGFRDTVTETAQVINGRFHSNGVTPVFGLRPEDLFVGVQSAYLSNSLQTLNEGNVFDTRVDRSTDIFRSRRSNAIPSNFLSNVVDSYRAASTLADFGQGTEDIYGRAIQTSHEASPYENPFIRAISDAKGMINVTYFTMEDLVRIDPMVTSNTHYDPVKETIRLTQPGDGESWAAATLETQLATVLSNAVSGLMVDCMLVDITFSCTNMTIGSIPDTRIIFGQGVTTADMRQYYINFVTRFESEVLPDLTQGNMIPIDILVSADLYGDTKIELSVEGAPHVTYITPSFCDALMAPVVTTNANEYHGLIHGIEHIVKNVGESGYANNLVAAINNNI